MPSEKLTNKVENPPGDINNPGKIQIRVISIFEGNLAKPGKCK
jgi:hypothetical protein